MLKANDTRHYMTEDTQTFKKLLMSVLIANCWTLQHRLYCHPHCFVSRSNECLM